MKLVTFKKDQQIFLGALCEAENIVVDLQRAHAELYGTNSSIYRSMQSLIDSGEPGLQMAQQLLARMPKPALVALNQIELLAPLPRPVQMRDFLCFETYHR